ncbi:MAG: hypothetical protein A2X12_10525 [Bacteroidetes bacterium GWE2_29_8]|nr:MAG: hypothetical protein A2X12_10525 [Bacteroidetes bacterium GWE2_29_8]OFY23209.1 MAG: hypothetical protein A2X02_09440 [Bacteroidetes bacterium GWF2_29_10]
MGNFFISINNFLYKHKLASLIMLACLLIVSVYFLFRLDFEENINSIVPQDSRIDELNLAFNNSKLASQIIFNISFKYSISNNPDKLIEVADNLVAQLSKDSTYIKEIKFKINEKTFLDVYDFIYNNLPLYLDDKDYEHIQSLLNDKYIEHKLENNLKVLISPTGIATKKYIFNDPLSITPLALKKLQSFQIDKNFTIYNSCIFTNDQKHLLIFIEPYYPSNNTKMNSKLITLLDNALINVIKTSSNINVEYYGGTAVAVANSTQIKQDIIITVSISIIFLSIIFWLFFRRFKVILLLFLPVAIGALLSLAMLSIVNGAISIISLGIGAILIGISVDYPLHAFTHYRESNSVKNTIKKIALPVLLSSMTTSATFMCLFVIHSEAIKQLSMFAAFAITFTSLSVLVIMPFFLKEVANIKSPNFKTKYLEKIIGLNYDKNKILIISIMILSVFFIFSSQNLKFNSDIGTLNYITKKLSTAENNLKSISSVANSAVYVIAQDTILDSAIRKSEQQKTLFQKLISDATITAVSSASDLIMSAYMQQQKIDKWNKFWDKNNKKTLKKTISEKGKLFHFKESAFNDFYKLLDKNFSTVSIDEFELIKNNFLSNYINSTNNTYYVASILKVDLKHKNELLKKLNNIEGIIVFDKQIFVNKLFDILKENFNKLSLLSMLVVFCLLLIFFGRIEIAIITFIPVALCWLWTLGLMGFFNIEFNIFNVIVLSFIFGLGLDYSIFIMSGLIDNYKYGNVSLVSYKLSVFLSAITTIGAFGVLILAEHPALKSIAIVSIIGISSALVFSYTILPLFFNFIINNGKNKRIQPINLVNSIISIGSFFIFLLGSITMTTLLPILFCTPIRKKSKKYFMSYIIYIFSKFIVYVNITIKRDYIDMQKLDFSKPSIIISNHQSHLDLVLLLMLNPKIIVFTNQWVWNNPFYGFIIRYAEFYPAYKGLNNDIEKIKRKVNDGYSILIFPEGKRTFDGEINRFQQGAFNIAHELGIAIQPIMIHGAYNCLSKTDFFLKSGHITIKVFDKFEVETPMQTSCGVTYREQTKKVLKFYRSEYAKLRLEKETPDFYYHQLIHQYIYKGPVLEWYLRVKIRMEKQYKFYNNIIPMNSNIVDIGCGYGFLSCMLRMVSKNRIVTGIDYDEEKISIANNIPIKDDCLNFKVLDISESKLPNADVFILNDVLHYMPENVQINVLSECVRNVSSDGMIIIRDADADLKKRTKRTKLTEIQSTKIFKFNKTKCKLTFISGKKIQDFAKANELICEIFDNSYYTSNITYVLRKKNYGKI